MLGEEPLELALGDVSQPSEAIAPTERQLSQPDPAVDVEAAPAPPPRPRREKVDPWRKDPEAKAEPALPPPPPPKASPTRPDISGGLYKKFKR